MEDPSKLIDRGGSSAQISTRTPHRHISSGGQDVEDNALSEAEILNALSLDLTSELDLQTLLQKVTDAGTQLTAAHFGAFFYNSINDQGESYLLYTLSGAPREAFERFGVPRNTPLFEPTFRGEGVVRIPDVLQDDRYGQNPPHRGMPEGHLPVRSYLAVPVVSRSGSVFGGLFFGHPEPDVFSERAERLALGVAAQASVAIENARLFEQVRRDMDDRKRAEAALRESEQRYRQLVESSSAAIYMCDADGRITLFNRAAAELWGREPVLGEDRWCGSWQIYRTDGTQLPLDQCPTAITIREGRPTHGEEVIVVRPDGSRRNVLPHPELLHDTSGKIVGAVSMLLDVTELKRAEQLNSEQNVRMQAVVNSVLDAIITICLDGTIESVNAAAEKMFGYTANEIIGRNVSVLMPPPFRDEHDQYLHNYLDTGVAKIIGIGREAMAVRKDGTEFPIDLAVTEVKFGNRRLFTGVVRDISDRRRAEQAFRESEELFRTFTTKVPVAIFIKDLRGRYTLANPLASEALGRPEGVVGMTDHDLLPADVADRLRQRDLEVISTGQAGETVEIVEREGFHADYLSVKFPLVDAQGRTVGVCGVATDITQRRRDQEALQESEERFARFMQHLPGLAWIKDATGKYVYANVAASNAFQIPLDDLHGKTDAEVFPAETADLFQQNDHRAFISEVGIQTIETLEQEDGVVHHSLVSKFPIPGRDGKPVLVGGMAFDITDQKQAEEALRESEARFRTLASHAPVGIFMSSPNGGTVFVNESWSAMTGLTPEQAVGSGWIAAVHPDDRQRVVSGWKKAVQAGVASDAEYRFLRPDGAVSWLQGNAVPFRGPEGEVFGYIGTVMDITDRKRAAEELKRTQEQLQQVTDTMAVAVMRCAADHRYEWVSVGCTTLLRKPREDIVGRAIPEVIGEEAYSIIRPYIERVLAGERVEYEAFVEYQDIGPRWIKASYVPTYGDTSTPDGWVAVVIDVTEEKRKEEAIRTSEQLYRAIGESNDYGVWVCDPEGRNIYASESFLRLVGMTQEECSNLGWVNALHPDDVGETTRAWNECVRTGSNWDLEHRFRGVDGKWHPILARGVPVRNDRGEITAWAGINLDISRLKKVEDELREADRRKDEFLAILAHELRNPLAPIRTGLELMRLAGDDQTLVEEVRTTMERQTQQMVRLIDDLLDVSRITRGTVELRKCRADLASVIQSAVETARPAIDEFGQRLTVSLPKHPIILDADPTRLAQVISNLLNNAAKYMTQGGTIELIARRQEDTAIISVKDSGVGIPAEMLDRIFEIFTQVDRSQEHSFGGLGIGLTLVKRLVEMHGGTVEAHSPGPGQGSKFVVRLPIVVGPLRSEPSENDEGLASSGKRRILVADDNEQAAKILAMLLQALGNEVRVARDGEETLQMADEFRPDIVLLDLGMPKLDGYETARRIREATWGKNMVLAALTGWGQEEDKRRTKEAGFNHHFIKPVELSTLEQLLAD